MKRRQVSHDVLQNNVRDLAFQILSNVFRWDEMAFRFDEGPIPVWPVESNVLVSFELIIRAMRSMAGFAELRGALLRQERTIRFSEQVYFPFDRLTLSPSKAISFPASTAPPRCGTFWPRCRKARSVQRAVSCSVSSFSDWRNSSRRSARECCGSPIRPCSAPGAARPCLRHYLPDAGLMMKSADILKPNLEHAQTKVQCIGHDITTIIAGAPGPVRFIETQKPALSLSGRQNRLYWQARTEVQT